MDFTIDGVRYQARKMDAFTQFDILAKITPLLTAGAAEILPLLREVRDSASIAGLSGATATALNLPMDEALRRFGPAAQELAKMTPEDRRFVIGSCLSLVDREIAPNKWAAVWVPAAGRAADDAINDNAWLMLRIVGNVIIGTLGRFFLAAP